MSCADMVSDTDVVVANGCFCIPFQAGVPRGVPKSLVDVCISQGVTLVGGPVPPVKLVNEHGVLVDVMLGILAEANPKLMTSKHEPRNDVVMERAGFKFSRVQREAAWTECCVSHGDSE